MRRIVAQHLGLWVLAGALFAILGVASAMPAKDFAQVTTKERVLTPRAAQTMVQDPSGMYIGFRGAHAFGAM